jgi:hypothetical protein
MARPEPEELVYCVRCRRTRNGKGWYGPGCMCDVPTGRAPISHSIKCEKVPV